MEMENVNSPVLSGVHAPSPDWAWFWQSIGLLPDVLSYPPRDMSGWCHEPLVPTPDIDYPEIGANEYGDAMVFPNGVGSVDFAMSWMWSGFGSGGVVTGSETHREWTRWTLALGWRRTSYHPNAAAMTEFWGTDGDDADISWRLSLLANGALQWRENGDDNILTSSAGTADASANGPTQSVVVTTIAGVETQIFYNGKLVASGAFGVPLRTWFLLHIGSGVLLKENNVLAGAYGPYILSRHAWSDAEVAQWAADPWGFMASAWAPKRPVPSDLECDVQTRPAVETDVQARPAVECDTQTQSAVETDVQTQPAVEGDVQARPAVEFDARTEDE